MTATPIESPVPKTNGISKQPPKAEIPQPAPRRISLPQNTNETTAKQPPTPVVVNNKVNGTTNQNNPSNKPEQNERKTASPSGGDTTGAADEQVLPKPITSEEFQAMIPAHFLNKTTTTNNNNNHPDHNNAEPPPPPVHAVTVTVKKPDPIELPPAPTGPGRVTETITKSTFTETVVTRITDNKLVVPVVIEV